MNTFHCALGRGSATRECIFNKGVIMNAHWLAKTLLVAVILFTGACGKKADISTGSPPEEVNSFPHLVEGQPLDGRWFSDCLPDDLQGGYSLFDLKFEGQKVERVVTRFTDSACTQFAAFPQSKRRGLYRYVVDHGGGIFEIEYRFEVEANGVIGFETGGENVRREGDVLWSSYRGRGAGVNPAIPLSLFRSTN